MDLLENPKVIFLIVVVAISLAKHYLEALARRNADAEQETTPDEWETSIPVPPRRHPEKQPAAFVPPPIVRSGPPPLRGKKPAPPVRLRRQQVNQERLEHAKETKTTTTGDAAATRNRIAAVQKSAKPALAGKSSLSGELRNRKDVRRAILTREILGPPLGLR